MMRPGVLALLLALIPALAPAAALAQQHVPTGVYSYTDRQVSTPTVTASAYASGNSVGGVNSITFTASGNITLINELAIYSVSGQTPTLWVYLFDGEPSGTFTDKGTFSLAAGDRAKLIMPPFALTLVTATGDDAAYAEAANLVRFPAAKTGTLWYALASGSTFTPGSTSDIVVSVQAAQREQGVTAGGGMY